MRGADGAETRAGARPPRALLRAVLSSVVVLAILALLVRALGRSWREAGVYDWSMNARWMAASVAVLAVYFPFVAWIWKRIVRSLGEEISFRGACRVWFLSQLGKYVPGKIWFAMGRIALSRREGLTVLAASASTVLELLLVMLAGGAVFFASGPLWPSAGRVEAGIFPIAILAVLFLLHPRVFEVVMKIAGRILRHPGNAPRLSWRALAAIGGLYAASWLLYGVGIDFLLRGIRLEGAAAGTLAAGPGRVLWIAGAAAVAWAAGFLSVFAPGGLGVREASFAYLLSLHLPPPLPILLALVSRVWILIGEAVSVAVAWRLDGGRP